MRGNPNGVFGGGIAVFFFGKEWGMMKEKARGRHLSVTSSISLCSQGETGKFQWIVLSLIH